LNAIFKGVTGQQFQLITITDMMCCFLNYWQKQRILFFEHFPKAGAVSSNASSKQIDI
jgi:hypothetical protein